MKTLIKTADDIKKMRVACQMAASTLEMITPYIEPGVTTETLNEICHSYIVNELDAIPAPLNYRGFPKSICTSINHQICHGIPGPKKLKNGDILNIDVTVIKDGFHGDTSKMFCVGTPSILAKRLCEAARECLFIGIEQVKPGNHIGDIGKAIEAHAAKHRFSVVREYVGHGIGRGFHEEPTVFHFNTREPGEMIVPGMTFTVEPMINAGKHHTKLLPDGWTVVTKDRSLSAQWEHTLLVTESGHEILTKRSDEL